MRVTPAANLAQAQAALQAYSGGRAPLHAVITDHWLGDGQRSHHVLDWAEQHWPGLPMAVVSGGAGSLDEQAITRRGARFWRKPLASEVLHAWLSELPHLPAPH